DQATGSRGGVDFLGRPRPHGAASDIGAIEWQGEAAATPGSNTGETRATRDKAADPDRSGTTTATPAQRRTGALKLPGNAGWCVEPALFMGNPLVLMSRPDFARCLLVLHAAWQSTARPGATAYRASHRAAPTSGTGGNGAGP